MQWIFHIQANIAFNNVLQLIYKALLIHLLTINKAISPTFITI